jgi:hypothetical protein
MREMPKLYRWKHLQPTSIAPPLVFRRHGLNRWRKSTGSDVSAGMDVVTTIAVPLTPAHLLI